MSSKGGEIMGYLDDVGQKIEGKVEEIKGNINQQRGKGVKGGIQKIKGMIKQYTADTKLKAKRVGAKGDDDWDRDDDW